MSIHLHDLRNSTRVVIFLYLNDNGFVDLSTQCAFKWCYQLRQV